MQLYRYIYEDKLSTQVASLSNFTQVRLARRSGNAVQTYNLSLHLLRSTKCRPGRMQHCTYPALTTTDLFSLMIGIEASRHDGGVGEAAVLETWP